MCEYYININFFSKYRPPRPRAHGLHTARSRPVDDPRARQVIVDALALLVEEETYAVQATENVGEATKRVGEPVPEAEVTA